MKSIVIVAGLAWSATVRADQCQLVDDAVASRAVQALAGSPDVIQFCEPCGDKAPGEPVRAARVEKSRDAVGDYEVVIDRREVDLAYTYVETSPTRYENVAALAGCPTSGVSPSLRVDDATTAGVMIHADPAPVGHAAEPSPPPATAHDRDVVHTTPAMSWWQILLACCGTSTLWALGTIAVIRRHRHRFAMRPRAAELVDRS